MEAMQTMEYKNHTIEIHYDEGGWNPREWDNAGIFVMFHNRYNFGDKHNFNNPDELDEYLADNNMLVLPVYMYDHSGVTIKTTPFGCRWDSGQIGYIYMSAEDAKAYQNPYEVLDHEIKVLDSYLRGEVYGYKIFDDEGEELDSCWNFIGDWDYCVADAKAMIDYYEVTKPKQYELELA